MESKKGTKKTSQRQQKQSKNNALNQSDDQKKPRIASLPLPITALFHQQNMMPKCLHSLSEGWMRRTSRTHYVPVAYTTILQWVDNGGAQFCRLRLMRWVLSLEKSSVIWLALHGLFWGGIERGVSTCEEWELLCSTLFNQKWHLGWEVLAYSLSCEFASLIRLHICKWSRPCVKKQDVCHQETV